MNRAEYYRLRHEARTAQRAWWAALSNPHANQNDKDSARDRMYRATFLVPGGVSSPTVPPVLLDGWIARRRHVHAAISERKRKAHIADRMEAMSQFFGVAA